MVKSYINFYLGGRSLEEVFVLIFKSFVSQCYNFLLFVEIVFIWFLLIVVMERGFSSMNWVKMFLRLSMSQENLDDIFRILIKYYLILKVQRFQEFFNFGFFLKVVSKFCILSI